MGKHGIFRCIKCNNSLDVEMRCKFCNSQYMSDINDVLSIIGELEPEKKRVEMLYNILAKNKNKNALAKFSTYLNYGILDSNSLFEGGQKTSLNLIYRICKNINLSKKRILEISCGRGGNIFYINNHFQVNYLAGIDLSYENILFCQLKKENIDFVRADAENIPFLPGTFDVVINIESALHYPNVGKFYCEVARILEDNGIFIYADIIECDDLECRKKLLEKYNLKLKKTYDYTELVINSMCSSGVDKIDDSKALFEHSKMYKDLCNKEKKYILWIMEKDERIVK